MEGPSADKGRLGIRLDEATATTGSIIGNYKQRLIWKEIGRVTSATSGIARVEGLESVGCDELIEFENGALAIALNLDEDDFSCVLLSPGAKVKAGMEVTPLAKVVDTPVGEGLVGRVIDPLGNPLDRLGPLEYTLRKPIENKAVDILDRAPVSEPLETGIKVIDALIPIGKGQRELILGDRQTGKTAIAIDTIINQKGKDVICIYCVIGRRSSATASIISKLKDLGCMDYTIVIVAEGNDPPGLRYIAPYAATTIGEYFMYKGRDALVVFDDLTNHARTYREISLLLRRPPGREAYPGDIFYLHSRLLERSTRLAAHLGGGSLTSLPIIETQADDISAYIPTNLISITDGQIYLTTSLFQKNKLPAIDVARSVSRVGGKAQTPSYRETANDLKLSFAQFEELESFSRFGTKLDSTAQSILLRGERIRECFTQPKYKPLSMLEQVLIFHALQAGLFDSIEVSRIKEAEILVGSLASQLPDALKIKITGKSSLPFEDKEELTRILRDKLESL